MKNRVGIDAHKKSCTTCIFANGADATISSWKLDKIKRVFSFMLVYEPTLMLTKNRSDFVYTLEEDERRCLASIEKAERRMRERRHSVKAATIVSTVSGKSEGALLQIENHDGAAFGA